MRIRGYAVCGAPRSGSNFLCSLLRSTDLLGFPREYFNTQTMRAQVGAAYPDDPELQMQVMTQRFMTANGVYGLKMFTSHFDRVGSNRWAERLPELSFVFLGRRDLLGQAISLVRAMQTGTLSTPRSEASPSSYDSAQIAEALTSIARQQARWRYFFARNGVTALNLTYEDLIADPNAAVGAIARLVDVPHVPWIDTGAARLGVQRDEVSAAWRSRFIAESRNVMNFG